MKKRMDCMVLAVLWIMIFPLIAGAVTANGALTGADESKIYQGYIVGGVIASDGDGETEPEALPDAPSFTVTFQPNADDATVKEQSKRVTNGRAYGELPTPERHGYVFDGWQTLSGAKITANTAVNLSGDQTLYAQWKVLTYEVRFDANGGSVKRLSIDVPVGGDYGALPSPLRGGYVFEGWYTQPNGGERVFSYAPLTREEDHTLYAHWTALPSLMENYSASPEVFADVPPASSYYTAVRWAVEQGITSGTSPDTFSPNDPCKRRHILTFLWRANGCPETQRVFDSVIPGTMWAYENGLIPRDALYSDEEASTRSDAVTYLWKLAGSPTESASLQSVVSRFTDVPPESDYAAAIAWALDSGITKGTTDTTFSPDRICTRGQIVTFLYRCYQ